jgi:hypothetical protein
LLNVGVKVESVAHANSVTDRPDCGKP